MRDGAATMKRVTLDLGGKSPTVLLDAAALDQAIPAALTMVFLNSGQACAAGTRLLVPKSRLEAVKLAIKDALRALRAGRVVINGMTDDPQAPWGGFKYSGVGREYGRYGIEAFLETRAILES